MHFLIIFIFIMTGATLSTALVLAGHMFAGIVLFGITVAIAVGSKPKRKWLVKG